MKLCVIVKPNKRAAKIIATDDGLIVELKSKPIDGAANIELIETLSAHFNVARAVVAR